MTPKEKAKELFDKVDALVCGDINKQNQKDIALFCVDEMYESVADFYTEDIDMVVAERLDYLNKVKDEIKLL